MRRILAAALFAVSFAFAPIPASAVGTTYTNVVGNVPNVYNVTAWPYLAKCDGSTDDTTPFNNAISDAATAGGGTVYVKQVTAGVACKISGSLVVPNSGATNTTQKPIRITGSGGPAWNGYWSSVLTNGGAILDLQYTGGDGLHPAKIDTRGAGYLEIDHLTLEDTGGDNFLFLQTTNTTVNIHDNAIIGNTANTGTSVTQDAIRLGANGYTSSSANITVSTTTLTNGGGDPAFTPAMVGDFAYIGTGATLFVATITAYTSAHQVTIGTPATYGLTNGPLTVLPNQNTEMQAPFQGYGSTLARNYYSHIQRGVIFGAYANNVVVENETYSLTCGSGLTYGAPYYFDSPVDVNAGDVIRGSTVEVANYPYLVSGQSFAIQQSIFDNIGAYDATSTTQGEFYFNNILGVNDSQNTIIEGYANQNKPLLTSPSGLASATNVIISGGYNRTIQFPVPIKGNAAIKTVTGLYTDDNNVNGDGLYINSQPVLFSNGGSNNLDLDLKTPNSSGSVNLLAGGAWAPTKLGTLTATGGGSFGGTVDSTSAFNGDSGNANGFGLQINGHNVAFSDGGGSNLNLDLKPPGSGDVKILGNTGSTVLDVAPTLVTLSQALVGTSGSFSSFLNVGGNVGITGTLGVNSTTALTGLLTASGGISTTTVTASGAVTGTTIPKIFQNGTQLTSSPHIELWTGTITPSTVTILFHQAYAAAPVCTATIASGVDAHSLAIGSVTTTGLQVADETADAYTVMCIGQ